MLDTNITPDQTPKASPATARRAAKSRFFLLFLQATRYLPHHLHLASPEPTNSSKPHETRHPYLSMSATPSALCVMVRNTLPGLAASSAGGPISSTRPSPSTITLSHAITVANRCAIVRTVLSRNPSRIVSCSVSTSQDQSTAEAEIAQKAVWAKQDGQLSCFKQELHEGR